MDSGQHAAASGGTGNNGIVNAQGNNTNNNEGTTSDDASQNLSDVTNSIEKTLGLTVRLFLQCHLSAPPPPTNSLVLELDNMMKLSSKCNIQVPMEVLNLIDDGKIPDEFTRDVLNSCIAKNQITEGKTDAFKHLLEELEQAFPSEVEGYRDIRASSAAEMKRMALVLSALPNRDVKVKSEL